MYNLRLNNLKWKIPWGEINVKSHELVKSKNTPEWKE